MVEINSVGFSISIKRRRAWEEGERIALSSGDEASSDASSISWSKVRRKGSFGGRGIQFGEACALSKNVAARLVPAFDEYQVVICTRFCFNH